MHALTGRCVNGKIHAVYATDTGEIKLARLSGFDTYTVLLNKNMHIATENVCLNMSSKGLLFAYEAQTAC